MIARYTRRELGAIWTDDARMKAWRRVEVAAARRWTGPTGEDLEAIRAATFTVEAVKGARRSPTTMSPRSSTCSLRVRAPPGAGSTTA